MEPKAGTKIQPTKTHVGDLFDYDVGLDEILAETTSHPNTNPPRPSAAPDAAELGLGLDEEIKVTRKRSSVARLDENRLLSPAGISKLRRSVKQNLKLKGKGHEFSDAARILNFYQLWLDDLFPRAKFTDGLTIIEKLGHSKRMQTMRRAWIEEEKPGNRLSSHERDVEPTSPSIEELGVATEVQERTAREQSHPGNSSELFQTDINSGQRPNLQPPQLNESHDKNLFVPDDEGEQTIQKDAPEDDELDALLRERESDMTVAFGPPEDLRSHPSIDEYVYDDALDA